MDLIINGIPVTLALAVVAVLGYLFGRSQRKEAGDPEFVSRRELRRAQAVVRHLESISYDIRQSLATHHSNIMRFKDRVTELSGGKAQEAWQELCQEAETMMRPTMKLAAEIAHAYDQIRQQTNLLMTFTEVRTDPLTGLSNRRGLDDSLRTMLALWSRYHNEFSLAIFDIDHFKLINDHHGHLHGDQVLQRVSKAIDDAVRDTDIVARFGGEEFVVIMPETNLAGACIFAERMRKTMEGQLSITVSAGVATVAEGDTAKSILGRADAALYSAKAAGRNCVFYHNGKQIELCENPSMLAAMRVENNRVQPSRNRTASNGKNGAANHANSLAPENSSAWYSNGASMPVPREREASRETIHELPAGFDPLNLKAAAKGVG